MAVLVDLVGERAPRRRRPRPRGRRPACAGLLRRPARRGSTTAPRPRLRQHVLSALAFLPRRRATADVLFESSKRKVRRASSQMVHPQVLVITPRPSGDDAFLKNLQMARIVLYMSVTSVSYRIEMPLRECEECRRAFEPSSRHLRCPACRARDLCTCGRPKQAKSATCGTCRSDAGDTNGNWKGGRTRHKAGYIMVRAPGHPRAGRSPYVFEHILVAEEILGRHLVDGESVHHRNGVRDDNRPENLEFLDASSTVRHQGERRHRVGTPDLRTLRGAWCTSNDAHAVA